MNQKEYIGLGSIRNIDAILDEVKPSAVFLVTGKESYATSGAQAVMRQYEKRCRFIRYSDIGSNPTDDDIRRGLEQYRKQPIDLVIAIGGGSVIDVAKSVNILAVQPIDSGDIKAYITGKSKMVMGGKPLLAIPTTAGTGSEATHFSVVYMDGIKYSLAHPAILPQWAIIDPELTYSLPARIAAVSGADALCQSIESLWSVRSTDESKDYARKSLNVIKDNIAAAVKGDKKARDAMSLAAHLSGKAINISKTTASHAMSYPLTMRFGIPHGQAVALTLSRILVFNSQVSGADGTDPRGSAYVNSAVKEILEIFGLKNPQDAVLYFSRLLNDIGLASTFSELSIYHTDADIESVISEISAERAGNNPRRFTKEDARGILEDIR